jgi:hypothetical protein
MRFALFLGAAALERDARKHDCRAMGDRRARGSEHGT